MSVGSRPSAFRLWVHCFSHPCVPVSHYSAVTAVLPLDGTPCLVAHGYGSGYGKLWTDDYGIL